MAAALLFLFLSPLECQKWGHPEPEHRGSRQTAEGRLPNRCLNLKISGKRAFMVTIKCKILAIKDMYMVSIVIGMPPLIPQVTPRRGAPHNEGRPLGEIWQTKNRLTEYSSLQTEGTF